MPQITSLPADRLAAVNAGPGRLLTDAMPLPMTGSGGSIYSNDAEHYGFLQSQVAHLEETQWRIMYADIQYPMLVPVDRSAWEWAPSIQRYTMDGFGKAAPMGVRAQDMPLVAVTREQLTQFVESYWLGFDYQVGELEMASRLPAINLLEDKARIAARVMEETMDDIVLNGRPEYGWDSLLNATGVSKVNAANNAAGNSREWVNKTGIEIANDINNAIDGIYTDTSTVIRADTVLLPPSAHALISRTLISSEFDRTVLQWVMENNSYTAETGEELMIRVCRGLENAAAGDAGRLVAYLRDRQVLVLHCPMTFHFDDAFLASPYRYVVPGMMRTGGLEIRIPGAVRYVDGITS